MNIKGLLVGILILVVLGVGGLVYRNALERPGSVACTLEARVCPDGSAVGRTGPSCAFAPCSPPNVELPALEIAFVLPAGYTENKDALGSDTTLIAAYEKPSLSEIVSHAIVVRRYPIPSGESALNVIIDNTIFEPSDMGADSMDDFTSTTISGNTFYRAVVERFEAQVHSVYYLPRATDVLRFEILERDITEWMEPALVVEELPEHAGFLMLLATLQGS